MKYMKLKMLLACATALLLSSCGGSKIMETIGGTVTGLSGNAQLVLQDNGGDNLSVNGNGTGSVSFAFATQIEAGSTYNVTILTQPTGENCVVESGVGVVQQSIGNVNSIAISCAVTPSSNNDVAGQVNGLNSGNQVVLVNNGTDKYTVTGIGASPIGFAFSTPLALGASYSVAVLTNPSGQTCSLVNANGMITQSGQVPNPYTDPHTNTSGTNVNNVVANVLVTCK